ncbi:C40 family peptidase [Dethiothermospora halolimnae]|uniref:C40 family peptidase n=1 Tax=Dethiothermospora halolimnae TaxID=3114390 RepID=UPI003CCBA7FB
MNNDFINKKIKNLIPKYRNAKFKHNGRSLEEGIDCLGFIILFYREFGVDIPNDDGRPIEEDWYKKEPDRYIRAIKNMNLKEVKVKDLQPLDMVYFAVSRNIITHTGIMINKRQFIHMSPKSGFLISKLERHWLRRFRGAMRIIE